MKKFFNKFVWLFEFIAVALIVTFAIILVTALKEHKTITYIPFGIAFVVLGVARFIPLIKTTNDKVMKWMNGIELIVDILAGVFLITIGFVTKKDILGNYLGYIICAVLYLRAFVYFFSTVIRKENATLPMFFVHIFLITISSVLVGMGSFNTNWIIWVVFAICILCAIVLLIDGIKKYSGFRNEEYAKKLSNAVNVETEVYEIETPSAEEIIEEGEIREGENPQDGLNA